MNPQDLKKGQSYLILANFEEKDHDDDYVFIAEPTRRALFLNANAVQACVSLPSEPPPSFGSFRLFRKGDEAEIVQYKGRAIIPIDLKIGNKVKVCENEKTGDSVVYVIDHLGRRFWVNPAFLELITPIEEQEPYEVRRNGDYWSILDKNGVEVSRFWLDLHPHAKEAAEAECARINAEFRKNLNND